MNNSNTDYYFDFSGSTGTSGQVNMTASVDGEMSDISLNPVANAVIKKYVDENKGKLDVIYADENGTYIYTGIDIFKNYDFILFYASASETSYPGAHSVPIRYLHDAPSERLPIRIADNDAYTDYIFTDHGVCIEKYSGDTRGKIYGIYGVRI